MQSKKQQYDVVFTTSIATIGLRFEQAALVKLDYLPKAVDSSPKDIMATAVKEKVENYINGKSKFKLKDIHVQLSVTSFQKKVLEQLQAISYGETKTYGEIAKILTTSPRAVGNACRNNPVPIIIPCHRVISAKGIGGYSGETSGDLLDIKYQLLKLEGVY